MNPITSYTIKRYNGFCPEDFKNFIRSRWMRSYRFGNDYIKLADSDSYFAKYTYYLTILLSHPEMHLRIAALTESPDVALGFSVCRGNILDYVHVQKDFRKQGIGMKLIPNGINTFTHLTRTGIKLWSTKLPNAKFNPFA